MSEEEPDPEELLQSSAEKRRTDSAADSNSSEDNTQSLEDAVAEAFTELEDGDLHPNLSFRDEHLSALFAALDETGEIDRVIDQASQHVDVEDLGSGQSRALRILVRVGLETVAPETLDAGRDGYRDYLSSQADSF